MNINNDSTSIQRLEYFLKVWEDTLAIAEATISMHGDGNPDIKEYLRGSVINWKYFRTELLSRRQLDEERFSTPSQIIEGFFGNAVTFDRLPFMIRNWSVSSRRVYDLSSDFQRSLELTSIGSVGWNDVTFPFPVFAVSLSIPLKWPGGEADFILVEKASNGLRLFALSNNTNGRKFLTEKKKERIADLLRRRRFDKLKAVIDDLHTDHYAVPPMYMLTLPCSDKPIMHDIQELDFEILTKGVDISTAATQKLPEPYPLIMRIIIGLCLHIEQSAKSNNTSRQIILEPWTKPPKIPTIDPRAITSESLVCTVNTVRSLSPEETKIHTRIREIGIEAATRELSTHYRHAHWRRKPGMANDPNASKCVKVSWSLVNKHRLPEQGLAGGSQIKI